MKTWQERYADWVMRQTKGRCRWISRWNTLWINTLWGVVLALFLIWFVEPTLARIWDDYFSLDSLVASVTDSDAPPEEKIRFLKSQNEHYRTLFLAVASSSRTYLYFAAAGVLFLFFLIGLVAEERKGYHRLIERLSRQGNTKRTVKDDGDHA